MNIIYEEGRKNSDRMAKRRNFSNVTAESTYHTVGTRHFSRGREEL
jgi:hypothetical protein